MLPWYLVWSMEISPWFIGWPAKRPRFLAAAFKIGSLVFKGSTEEFTRLFECRVELDGRALLLASPRSRIAELRCLAAGRGNTFKRKRPIFHSIFA